MEALYEILGLVGVVFYMLAYSLLQLGKINGDGYLYTMLNLVAAVLVLVSLVHQFNLASVIIQLSWIVFSLIGFIRIWYSRRSSRKKKRRSRRTLALGSLQQQM
ncbi:hypothetical protein AB833_21570 [Chromatiales bacterium (ex Bugula neritina AB1)]|nr:hypothetical protein AB833_21570 [Chromatiales bacterium (ex Bugula neritina AB1)]